MTLQTILINVYTSDLADHQRCLLELQAAGITVLEHHQADTQTDWVLQRTPANLRDWMLANGYEDMESYATRVPSAEYRHTDFSAGHRVSLDPLMPAGSKFYLVEERGPIAALGGCRCGADLPGTTCRNCNP